MLASSLASWPTHMGTCLCFPVCNCMCVYIHNVRGYDYITRAVALHVAKQSGLLLLVHPCSWKAGPAEMVLTDCTWCPRS